MNDKIIMTTLLKRLPPIRHGWTFRETVCTRCGDPVEWPEDSEDTPLCVACYDAGIDLEGTFVDPVTVQRIIENRRKREAARKPRQIPANKIRLRRRKRRHKKRPKQYDAIEDYRWIFSLIGHELNADQKTGEEPARPFELRADPGDDPETDPGPSVDSPAVRDYRRTFRRIELYFASEEKLLQGEINAEQKAAERSHKLDLLAVYNDAQNNIRERMYPVTHVSQNPILDKRTDRGSGAYMITRSRKRKRNPERK